MRRGKRARPFIVRLHGELSVCSVRACVVRAHLCLRAVRGARACARDARMARSSRRGRAGRVVAGACAPCWRGSASMITRARARG
jgi:hypothetical protein